MVQLARDAWLDRGIRTLPLATGSHYIYNHETGNDDDGSAMTSFIETAPMDMGDGDKFMSIKQMIPDITFAGFCCCKSYSVIYVEDKKLFWW